MGLAVLVVFCALSSACAREPQNPPPGQQAEKQGSQERSGIVTYEPSQTAAELTMAEGDVAILAGGTSPPKYEIQKDGTLIIGGDVLVSCEDVGSWEAPPSATRAARRQMRESQQEEIRVCTKAGFPPDVAAR